MNILVVEDEIAVREVICLALKELGHQAALADCAEEGLRKFDAGHFDLVLTDQKMPEMSGADLAKRLKEKNAAVPIVLLTGYGDIMKSRGEKPEGVDLIISKPFTISTLQGAIEEATQGRPTP